MSCFLLGLLVKTQVLSKSNPSKVAHGQRRRHNDGYLARMCCRRGCRQQRAHMQNPNYVSKISSKSCLTSDLKPKRFLSITTAWNSKVCASHVAPRSLPQGCGIGKQLLRESVAMFVRQRVLPRKLGIEGAERGEFQEWWFG